MKITALILSSILWGASCSRVFSPEQPGTGLRDLTLPAPPSLTIKERPYPYQDNEYRTFVSTARIQKEIQEVPIVQKPNHKIKERSE